MAAGELRVLSLDITCGLADDFNIANDRILHHFDLQKADFIHVIGVAMDTRNRLSNMGEKIRQPLLVEAHTGTVSASTR